ncbi:hypothetical protein ACF3DV_26355 [Chlorogloeopsis fritschii PCC 9212]|uniref:hypothetical protein n=1 Tax=Chlorogloeopsis fritschii TaxID=1124 RepID=UPI0002F499A4|nr:hypothetical protein [Chlorogloeopsis fritschii]
MLAYTEASELAQRGVEHCQYLNDSLRVRSHLRLLKIYVMAGVRRDRTFILEKLNVISSYY